MPMASWPRAKSSPLRGPMDAELARRREHRPSSRRSRPTAAQRKAQGPAGEADNLRPRWGPKVFGFRLQPQAAAISSASLPDPAPAFAKRTKLAWSRSDCHARKARLAFLASPLSAASPPQARYARQLLRALGELSLTRRRARCARQSAANPCRPKAQTRLPR